MKAKVKRNGFTLIELLVTISIIGILASLLLITHSTAQRQARNTQRRHDLQQYQKALENYATNNSHLYPGHNVAGGVSAADVLCQNELQPTYMSECLEDPRNTEDASFVYEYISDGDALGNPTALVYTLWAKIETSDGSNKWFAVCSNGKAGEIVGEPTDFNCPVP